MDRPPFQFEWDDAKAEPNARKHDVTFEFAASVFFDPNLLTVADLEHGDEERWFSIGMAANGTLLSIAYLWSDFGTAGVKVRLISARKATSAECRKYEDGL